jgi:Cys-tRNA(Pro) deacylase
MGRDTSPVTPAVRKLRAEKVDFGNHPYTYEEKGGTIVSARELGVDEHSVIKTLVMEDERKNPLIVLMHGDMQVSTKELARFIGVKLVSPCSPETAQRHSGYQIGGTSPFGLRRHMTVYMEESISRLERIYINGGKRGYLVSMAPGELIRVLKPIPVTVGI